MKPTTILHFLFLGITSAVPLLSNPDSTPELSFHTLTPPTITTYSTLTAAPPLSNPDDASLEKRNNEISVRLCTNKNFGGQCQKVNTPSRQCMILPPGHILTAQVSSVRMEKKGQQCWFFTNDQCREGRDESFSTTRSLLEIKDLKMFTHSVGWKFPIGRFNDRVRSYVCLL